MRKDSAVSVPPARFIQWKAVLRSGDPAPRVESVTLNYLPKNVAPDFDDVTVQVGVRYQSLPKPAGGDIGAGSAQQPHFDTPPPTTHDRDSIGVKWSVHDDNDDQMIYSVYYRGDGDTRWLLLKDNLTDKFYSFDASLLPDGGYTHQGRSFRRAFAFSGAGADRGKRKCAIRSGYDSAADRESRRLH